MIMWLIVGDFVADRGDFVADRGDFVADSR